MTTRAHERATAAAAHIDRVLLAAGRCPCDPTRGMSCRFCDGTADDERETRTDTYRNTRPTTRSTR